MRNSLVKALRTATEPKPGRKHGGKTIGTIEHQKAEPWEDPQRKPTKPEGERR